MGMATPMATLMATVMATISQTEATLSKEKKDPDVASEFDRPTHLMVEFTPITTRAGGHISGVASAASQVPGDSIHRRRVSYRYCIVPNHWTLEDLGRHTCHDGSHFHRTWSEIYEFMLDGVTVEHLAPYQRRARNAVKLRNLGARLNGLSCKVGEPLVVSVELRRAWALVMLDEILNGLTALR